MDGGGHCYTECLKRAAVSWQPARLETAVGGSQSGASFLETKR